LIEREAVAAAIAGGYVAVVAHWGLAAVIGAVWLTLRVHPKRRSRARARRITALWGDVLELAGLNPRGCRLRWGAKITATGAVWEIECRRGFTLDPVIAGLAGGSIRSALTDLVGPGGRVRIDAPEGARCGRFVVRWTAGLAPEPEPAAPRVKVRVVEVGDPPDFEGSAWRAAERRVAGRAPSRPAQDQRAAASVSADRVRVDQAKALHARQRQRLMLGLNPSNLGGPPPPPEPAFEALPVGPPPPLALGRQLVEGRAVDLKEAGLSLRQIAAELTGNYRTPGGGEVWHPEQVRRLLAQVVDGEVIG